MFCYKDYGYRPHNQGNRFYVRHTNYLGEQLIGANTSTNNYLGKRDKQQSPSARSPSLGNPLNIPITPQKGGLFNDGLEEKTSESVVTKEEFSETSQTPTPKPDIHVTAELGKTSEAPGTAASETSELPVASRLKEKVSETLGKFSEPPATKQEPSEFSLQAIETRAKGFLDGIRDAWERFIKRLQQEFSPNDGQHGGLLSDEILKDETHFWGCQLMEHAFFLHLGLETIDTKQESNRVTYQGMRPQNATVRMSAHPGDLKGDAYKLYVDWKNFLNQTFPGIDKSKIILDVDDFKNIKINREDVLKLIRRSFDLNKRVLDTQKNYGWVGWIYPSLVEHMQLETEYFQKKIMGPKTKFIDSRRSIEEEIKFINHHHATELAVTAQLVDPALENEAEITKIKDMSKVGYGLTSRQLKAISSLGSQELAALLDLSQKYTNELVVFATESGKKIKQKQLKSIIHPVVAEHVEREFLRFQKTLQGLSEILARSSNPGRTRY